MSNKRYSLLFLIVGIVVLLVITGCRQTQLGETEKIKTFQNNYELVGEEKAQIVAGISSHIFDEIDRSNEEALEEFVIRPSREVGQLHSLPEGRYQLHPEYSGNVYIRDQDGTLIYHSILGSRYGVETITIDLKETFTIEADGGLTWVYIYPVETDITNELTAGIWKVGLDVAPGTYQVTEYSGLGYFEVWELNEEPRLYELIGSGFNQTNPEVTLEEGQVIRLTGVSSLVLDPM
ncbi:hypothetical protein P4U44_02980 [Alkalihalobacillus alcalophilus]|nr:hypothetical protein [Alkalihalobacillus alcalophilus]MED1560875.1 hypothetical protein [Alkalihalobacillus alcalophilus]